MANKKVPAIIGFKPTAEDIKKIEAIKQTFPLPDAVSTAIVMRMAVTVWYNEAVKGDVKES